MRVNIDSLKGYILEEVLAYLIRTTGYRLLVDPSQDPVNLARRGNGLVVKGRGGVHQVDVLGELDWIPAFTFPLRLFAEAKFRNGKTGISDVRNAIGTVLDINQKNMPTREHKELPQKYHYAYALFSASGFSKPAMDMGLAYQISLVDLSGREFEQMRNAVELAAHNVFERVSGSREQRGYESSDIEISSRPGLVSVVRDILRTQLSTLPIEIQYTVRDIPRLHEALEPAIDVAKQYGELFVAMANGPFMLLLKADDPNAFLNYAVQHPRHNIYIRWSRQIDKGRTWEITPIESEQVYRLSFTLPEFLIDWIFGVTNGTDLRALQTKQDYFSSITIYRHVSGTDHLFRLVYNVARTREHISEVTRQSY